MTIRGIMADAFSNDERRSSAQTSESKMIVRKTCQLLMSSAFCGKSHLLYKDIFTNLFKRQIELDIPVRF